jgi:hypothetical protein
LSYVAAHGISPDRKTLVMGSPSPEGTFVLFPITGGTPQRLRVPPMNWRWTGDGKHLFVSHGQETYVLPVPPGHLLPEGFSKGFATVAEIGKLPGVRVLTAFDAVPGVTADVYAFTQRNVQRNLYRVPVP